MALSCEAMAHIWVVSLRDSAGVSQDCTGCGIFFWNQGYAKGVWRVHGVGNEIDDSQWVSEIAQEVCPQ
jgi:hypothetical protein